MKAFILGCILFACMPLQAQDRFEEQGYIKDITITAGGVAFTDNYASGVYRYAGGKVDTLASGPGCGMYYTVSPDGKYLAYKRITPAGQQPVVVDLAAGVQLPLPGPVALCSRVTFSANGSMAYAEGSTVHLLHGFIPTGSITLPSYANYISLSPNGAFLAANDAADRIFTVEIATGKTRYISPEGIAAFFPEWSANGGWLSWVSGAGEVFAYCMADGSSRGLGVGGRAMPVPGTDNFLFTRVTARDMQFTGSSTILARPAEGITEELTNPEWQAAFGVADGNSLIFTKLGSKLLFTVPLGAAGSRQYLLADFSSVLRPAPRSVQASVYIEDMDIPYVNQVYDTPDWYNGHSACGPTSSIMVIAYYKLLPKWDGWCSTPTGHYNSWGRYVSDKYRFRQFEYALAADDPNGTPSWGGYGYMWSTGSPHSRMVGYYNNHLISAALTESPPITMAETEVTAGRPYTLCNGLTTAGHIIVVHGVNTAQRTVVTNDPYGNKNNPGYPNYTGKNARYDWPGYNNGYQNLNTVYWGVSASAPAPAAADTLVDDLQFDRGFYLNNRYPATMASWKDMNQGYNNHFWYTYTKTSAVDTLYAVWQPAIPKTGYYRVSVYIPFSNAADARYKVQGADGISTVTINQKQYTAAWVPLGRFRFSAGSSGSVRLGDASSETGKEIVFDAMRWEFLDTVLTTAGDAALPGGFALQNNYPNPFNPTTTIAYAIPLRAHVTLEVFNAHGERVAALINEVQDPGAHTVVFNAAGLPSGPYFARLGIPGATVSTGMVFIK